MLPLTLIHAVGKGFGWLTYKLNLSPAKVTRRNVSLCYPALEKNELEALCEKSVCQTTVLALEVFLVWKRNQAWFESRVNKIHNGDLLTNAVAENKGVIILAPHIGNWEVLGKMLPQYGSTMSLYAPPKKQALEDVVKQSRQSSGATLVPTNNRGIAKLLKHLKGGGITGILPDQVPPRESGDYATFFGVNALTMTLVHGLYSRTKCRILVGAALRTNDGFEIHFLEPDKNIYSDDLSISLFGLNKSVEAAVALAPEQYQWEYKRFKRQQDKSISYYDF